MGDKIKKVASRNELMVIICLCIYIFLLTFTNTAWYTFSEGTKVYTIFKLLRYVSYLLLFIVIMADIIKHNYSRETLFYLICLLVFSFIGMFTGKNKALFFYIFLSLFDLHFYFGHHLFLTNHVYLNNYSNIF